SLKSVRKVDRGPYLFMVMNPYIFELNTRRLINIHMCLKAMNNGFIITAIISAIAICLLILDNNAYAQIIPVQNITLGNSTLYVMGDAQTTVKPDKVVLSLSVETTNTTANEALSANSIAMNNVLEALEGKGVRENETSTSFFNVSPNYNITQDEEDPQSIETRDIISYTVTNSITVDSYKLLNVSQWIDTAVESGVNDISSISFSLSDEKSKLIKNDLLKQAVADAKNKASIAVSALGLKVIGVKSIIIEGVNEVPLSPPQPFLSRESVADAATEDGLPTPIIAGEQQVTSSVNIVFFIG
ncbi:MAG: SIMPL domain-containing protein, partial [Thermoproteota archaeon]|nr:SIMPL domain-containing protein [Thermoproteota archaeon]